MGKMAQAFPEMQIKALGGNSLRCLSSKAVNVTPLIVFLDQLGLSVFEAKIIQPSPEDVFVKVTGIGLDQLKQEKGGGGKEGGKG